MYVAGLPCHLIQRGNNRQACFFSTGDRRLYIQYLQDACHRYRVQVHAYVLMTNHVHLLLTPQDREGVSRVMQSVGRRYVQHVNACRRRSGTLWEGRHKASLVEAERYLIACYRYIELNPVRAGLVDKPGDYCWSSYRRNAEGAPDPLVTDHPVYRALGQNPEMWAQRYRELFRCDLDSKQLYAIRNAANFSTPLGDARFKAEIEARLGVAFGLGKRGRPKSFEQSSCE
jgi:putative transposase